MGESTRRGSGGASKWRGARHDRVAALLAALWAAAPAAAGPVDLFADAAVAPPDVTTYVHLRDARIIRRDVASRPIAQWLTSLLEGGEIERAWARLAVGAGLPPVELLDSYLGRQVTVLVRQTPDGLSEWAMLTDVRPADARQLLERVRPRILPERNGIGLFELPEHDLLVARTDRRLIVGPAGQRRLLVEVLDRLGPDGEPAAFSKRPSLAAHPAVLRSWQLGGGQLGLLVRHEAPMGGWSAVTATFRGDRLDLRHASEFDSAPLQRRVTSLECDCSPVAAFEASSLLTMLEPMDVGEGPLETWLSVLLDRASLTQALARYLGDRRIITVGEREGRQLEQRVDLLCTTLAVCLELKNADGAIEAVDEQMVDLARRILAEGRGEFDFPIDMPPEGNAPRHIDIGPASSWVAGAFPIFRNVSLNWTVADSPHGLWCVISTNPGHLEEVICALDSDLPPLPPAKVDNVGTADGAGIGRHLQSWSVAENLPGPPEEVAHLRHTLKLMSEFSAGIERCHWKMVRPSPREVRVEVQMILAENPSAGK